MKIQERMYESSELTTEGTDCEIKKELVYEWECCGWIICETSASSRLDVLFV